jgi:hypothetical protein
LFLIACRCSLYLVLMLGPFLLPILMGSPCISFGIRHCFHTRLVAGEFLLSFVWWFFWSKCDLNICFFEKFCDIFCFFSMTCERNTFFMLLACILLCFWFLGCLIFKFLLLY